MLVFSGPGNEDLEEETHFPPLTQDWTVSVVGGRTPGADHFRLERRSVSDKRGDFSPSVFELEIAIVQQRSLINLFPGSILGRLTIDEQFVHLA